MIRRLLPLLFLLSNPAWAINLPTPPFDYFKSTALTGTGTVAVQSNGTSSVLVTATGSGTGLAFSFQCFDGVNWVSINAYPLSAGALGAAVTSGSANGDWVINSAGCAATSATNVRVNLTAITGGTETFTLNASAGINPNYTNLIPGGAVTANAGTNLNTSLLALESGGNLATLAGGVSASKYQENLSQVGGSSVATGGASGTQVVETGCAGQSVANTSVTAINNAGSSANLKLVSKVAAKNIYICAINIVAAAATNVALVDGTLTTNQCDTSQDGLAGGTTAATGWNFAANGGLTLGNGVGVVFKTAAVNKDVCLLFSAGNQVSGSITWAQF